jgi:hypothetical protein
MTEVKKVKELTDLLRKIRPNYGDVGTRDVEVAERQKLIDSALALLSQQAPLQSVQEPVATTYPTFTKGQLLESKTHGRVEFVGMDTYFGEITYCFKSHTYGGEYYWKPESLNFHLGLGATAFPLPQAPQPVAAEPAQIPRSALTEFINAYCNGNAHLIATAEATFSAFNEALAGQTEVVPVVLTGELGNSILENIELVLSRLEQMHQDSIPGTWRDLIEEAMPCALAIQRAAAPAPVLAAEQKAQAVAEEISDKEAWEIYSKAQQSAGEKKGVALAIAITQAIAAEVRALAAHPVAVERDAERLDWFDKNIFHREMDEWDRKQMPNSVMWVLFAPKGTQGSARRIIDAAIAAMAEEKP